MTTAAEGRRRVLLVTVELGVPPVSGRERRYWQHVVAIGASSALGVLVLDRTGRTTHRPDGLAWWGHSAARWLDDQVRWMERPDGHPAFGHLPSEGLAALDESLEEFEPDVIVVGGLWLHGHLERLRSTGRHVVLDAPDVEGPLAEALADVSGRGERTVRRVMARHVAEIEGRAVASVDQVWACSDHDARAIIERYPHAAPVTVVPNTVDTESFRRPPGVTRPKTPAVVYTAMFGYAPNDMAAMTLIDEIHPAVRGRFPDATLTLVGRGATPALTGAAAQAPGVTVTGPVRDPRPWLWGSSAQAMPLRCGSGTRIKALESLAASLPVVTTEKGVEGLDVVDGEHVLIARSAGQFADAIGFLHEDAAESSALAARGRALVEARYSTAVACRAVESALGRLPARTP